MSNWVLQLYIYNAKCAHAQIKNKTCRSAHYHYHGFIVLKLIISQSKTADANACSTGSTNHIQYIYAGTYSWTHICVKLFVTAWWLVLTSWNRGRGNILILMFLHYIHIYIHTMIMDIFPCSNENYRARGSIKQEFITDAKRRSACKIARIKTLAKKAHELEVMCGGKVIIHYSDPASNTYMYCVKETWEGYSDSVSAGKPAIPVKSSKTISHLDEDGESSATLTNHGKNGKSK